MHRLVRAAIAALALYGSLAHAQDAVPPLLRDWQTWVMHGEEFRRCPFLASANLQPGEPIDASAYRCVWPERLTLNVNAQGGSFAQRWQVYADSWVALPGDTEHWPRDVRLNGAPAALVEKDQVPMLRLAPGSYTISGRFEWSSRPEALALPEATAIVDLFVDGSRVAQPERPGRAVWLGKRRSAEQAAAMEVQVYRLIQDDIPAYLVTRIRLNVAGDAREEPLARVLPDGFTPVSLTGPLPARLERDGTMRVQVRAGSHELTLVARSAGVAGSFARPAVGDAKWARDEIWSFSANDTLRVAAVEGAEGIDPAQANVPGEWRQLPAFRMSADSKLNVVERSRGLANVDDNRLTLRRNLWLDFDHGGFTVVDNIAGSMRRDWRLDMRAPYTLASATLDGQQQLVTLGAEGRAGLELRQPRVNLTTIARQARAGGAMPATGWDSRFDQVSGTLHLPPGHRLLAAPGTDAAPGSWWENWGLWNVFGVLIIVVFVYWTAGKVPAAIAALALVLTYQEAPSYIWLWGNLLAALAIARAAPEGRFQRFARLYRTMSFVLLGVALLPFLWMQVRFALYPQLEPPTLVAADFSNAQEPYGLAAQWQPGLLERARDAMTAETEYLPAAPAAEAAAEAAPIEADIMEEVVQDNRSNIMHGPAIPKSVNIPSKASRLNSLQVVPRYAAGTVLQAGPGIPAWRYNSYSYSWSGPVEAADDVRFIFVGPLVMFFCRVIGVVALALLFGWLALLSFGINWRPPGVRMPAATSAAWSALALPLVLIAAAFGTASPANAQTPSTELLTELKARLTAAPRCAPNCAEIAAARVVIDGERLEVTLEVSALAPIAVAMPHASDRWQLDEVSVDSRGALAIAREGDASLWVPLTPGAHTVRLAGRLAAAESIPLAFPQAPRAITVSARGWTVSGVNEGRLVAGSLELARERSAPSAGGGAELSSGSEFPAFVRVDRMFNLDLDWALDTYVTRIAPQRAAMSLEIPLVSGESVQTDAVKVRDGIALVGLSAGEARTEWHSGLARADTFEISLPQDAARTEVWSFVVNPQWNVSFEGFPPVLPEDVNAPQWVFRFIPRPGEKLIVNAGRPKAAGGTTLAIDAVTMLTNVGKRSSSTMLEFRYRSTQGGRHVIKLPLEARVTSVSLDNNPVQLRPEKGELPLSLTPGSHHVQVSWEESRDIGFVTGPGIVDLQSPASNLRYVVALGGSRWALFARGPGIGPAILYWGELVVFIAVAWLLGRWSRSPLKFTEWLLLGLGLSTQSWLVFSLTAVWLLVMRWREQRAPVAQEARKWRFNAVQVLLALFTVITIAMLVFSGIRNGLLSAPDMGVRGPGLESGTFSWFEDQTTGVLETPSIYSVPMWVYRVLMLAWAVWIAFALVRWLRWAFNAWKTDGLWR